MSASAMAALIKFVWLAEIGIPLPGKENRKPYINRAKMAQFENSPLWGDQETLKGHLLRLEDIQVYVQAVLSRPVGAKALIHLYFQAYLPNLCASSKPSCVRFVPVAIVPASLMDSSHLVSFPPLFLCLLSLPYRIHVFPRGLIKRLSCPGCREKRREEG